MIRSLHLALALIIFPTLCRAQYGELDATFNGGGFATFGQAVNFNEVSTVFQQADGGIMAAYTCGSAVGLWRFSPDGEEDAAFGNQGGTFNESQGNRAPCALLEQPDGKLMLVARGQEAANAIRFIRHLANGQYDVSFGPGGEVTNVFVDQSAITVRGFKRLDDGRMLVGGTATSDLDRMFLARFLANGAPDPSFNGTGFRQYDVLDSSKAYDMEVRPDGRVLLVGHARSGTTRMLAALQVSADGVPDATFGTNGITITDLGFLGQELRAVSLQPNGSLLGCGVVDVAADDQEALLVRFTATGALDPTFSADGWSATDHGPGLDVYNDVILDDDGMILVTGAAQLDEWEQVILARYYPDGLSDLSFGTDGSVVVSVELGTTSHGDRLALQADGKVLVGGSLNGFANGSATIFRFSGGMAMSTAEAPTTHDLLAYPNPCSHVLQLELPAHHQQWDARIVDAHGRTVRRERMSDAGRTVLDVQGLAPGAYNVLLSAGQERYRSAFVKTP